MADAARSTFFELGFDIDSSELNSTNSLIDDTISSMSSLDSEISKTSSSLAGFGAESTGVSQVESEMHKVEDKTVKVGQELEKVNRDLDSTRSKAEDVARQFSDIEVNARDSISAFRNAFAVIAAGAGVTAFMKSGLEANANLARLEMTFGTLLGDSDVGKAFVSRLGEIGTAISMPRDTLASLSQTLLTVGYSSEQVENQLYALGNIARGNKENFEALSSTLQRVTATGRFTRRDMLNLAKTGFNPLQVMAEKTGTSLEVMNKLMDDGEISAKMVQAAFVLATEEGGKFYKGAESGKLTLEAQTRELQKFGSTIKRQLSTPVFIWLTEVGLPAINNRLGELQTRAKEVGMWQAFAESIGITTGALDIFGYTLEGLFVAVTTTKVWGLIVKGFKAARLAILGIGVAAAANPIGLLVIGLVSIAAVLATVIERTQGLENWLAEGKETWFGFKPGVDAAREGLAILPQKLNEIGDSIGIFFTVTIPSHLAGVEEKFVRFGEIFSIKIPSKIEELKTFFGSAWNSMKSSVRDNVNEMIGHINGFITTLNSIQVPSWIPGVGGKSLSIGLIPGFANGTMYAPGGPAIVGEKGPELLNLPTGSQVIPMNRLGGGNDYKVENTITIYADGATNETVERIRSEVENVVNEVMRKTFRNIVLKNEQVIV